MARGEAGAAATTAAGAGAAAAPAGHGEVYAQKGVGPKKRKAPLTVVYWIMFVGVLLFTLAFSMAFVRVLFAFNVLIAPGPVMLLSVFAVVSLLAGAVFSQIFIRSITKPLLEMSRATQRIAQGDFDIELAENTFAVEIAEMEDNFTMMARELSATEMLRSDFVSNVSHEIKTPLASIVGYATLLQKPELPEEQRQDYTDRILRSSRRLSNLTDNVLLLSRLENQEVELQPSTFSLSEQLRESILLYEGQWEDAAREMDIDLEEVDYTGSEELLADVWQNVIGNALKFTEPGDRIAVRLREEPERVVVQVEDSGIGMSEEDCARVFEKFYQADRSHATEGNGLGLALCKRIVDLHGGSIVAESELGQGTTITVTLPKVAPKVVA